MGVVTASISVRPSPRMWDLVVHCVPSPNRVGHPQAWRSRRRTNGLLAPEIAAGIARAKSAQAIGCRSKPAQARLNTPDITTAAGLHRAIITRRSVSRGLLARRFHFIPPA